ncbi:MAG TPA: glutamate mutase L [Chloroflexia bacterium]|nr:glutamate mutase L [Chloroflexia bacterium]
MNIGKIENTNPRLKVPPEAETEASATVATVGATLAVDIGSLNTRAALFDVVGDEYRFVARASALTTAESPYSDVTAGVYNAVRDLEAITGRKLTEDNRLLVPQRDDGSGIDLFIATASAAPALRVTIAAVSSDISEPSALQAVGGTYTHVVSHITLDEGIKALSTDYDLLLSSAAAAWLQEQTDKLLAVPPEVVLIAGGIEGGPTVPLLRLAKVVADAAQEQAHRAELAARTNKQAPGPPIAIYAGNSLALPQVARVLTPVAEVRAVPNLRPGLTTEQTSPAEEMLANLYREKRVPQIPGYPVLSRWVEGAIAPTAESTRLIARFLQAHYGRETLIADVGASATSLFLANRDTEVPVVRGEIGVAYGLANLLAERGLANVLRWLPFSLSEEDLTNWALNKLIRPAGLPLTARDLAIEHALACEALGAAYDVMKRGNAGEDSRYDLLIGTGGLLAYCPRPGQAARILLDALQPTAEGLGSVELAIDTTMLLPALGNLAHHNLAAASYIFDRDCLMWLGTAIVVQGDAPVATVGGEPPTAVTVTMERKGGGTDTIDVPYGQIRVVPLRPDQRAALNIKPSAGFRVGSGEPGKSLKTEPGQEIKGGLVGLIVDARGRPLTLAEDIDMRQAQMKRWWGAFDALPVSEKT